jgi:hypothetical protein
MSSSHPERNQKIKHELREMTCIFLYLELSFCALVSYDLFLLKQ